MLLLAAGRGRRFGADRPKVYLDCRGRSLLARSAERLAAAADRPEIVLAVHPEDRRELLAPLLPELRAAGVTTVVDGGETRQESMLRALGASSAGHPLVLVHDAARPFPPVDATREALERAEEHGAACLAIPAPDTLKRVDDRGFICETLDRSSVWLAQTPQVAQRHLLETALHRAEADGFQGTDDVSLLERTGVPVQVVRGSSSNIKVTTASDMRLAECIAAAEETA